MTGAHGFIGSHLVDELSSSNFEVVVIDLRRPDPLHFEGLDVVVHLAAATPQKVSGDQRVTGQRNLEAALAALEVCKMASCAMVFISTFLYRYSGERGVDENSELDLSSEYRRTKRLGELECEKHFEKMGLPVTVLRMSNVFGPGQGPEFLIPSLIQQVTQGGPVLIRSRDTKRDFLFIDDAIRAIKLSFDHLKGFDYFNVGSGRTNSVSEALDIIENKLGLQPIRIWGGGYGGGNSSPMLTEKFLAKVGWSPQVEFEEGLSRCVDFFVMSGGQL